MKPHDWYSFVSDGHSISNSINPIKGGYNEKAYRSKQETKTMVAAHGLYGSLEHRMFGHGMEPGR